MTRWENLQRAKALGQNHPDPKTRLLLKAFGEAEQNEEPEQEASGQLMLRLLRTPSLARNRLAPIPGEVIAASLQRPDRKPISNIARMPPHAPGL